jgi:hypothetical protein
MITLTYNVPIESKHVELDWLRDQKIFPAHQEWWDWATEKTCLRIGVIVSPEQALTIKLRHQLQSQQNYRQG